MAAPDPATTAAMLDECEGRYAFLVQSGVVADVARDRTWEAYECAFEGGPTHCFDRRDRIFENELRTIRQKGLQNEELQL